MATELPKFQELSHLPEDDRGKLLDELIRDLGLFLQTAPRFEMREFAIRDGEEARVELDYKPKGVIIIDVRRLSNPDTTASVESPDWLFETDEQGRGQLVFRDIEGLGTGLGYTVRILVVR